MADEKQELGMYDPNANKAEYEANPNMYNPNEPKEKIIDKEKLAQTLQSIGERYDSIPEDAMLEIAQRTNDGEKFQVAIIYPSIIEKLYKERTAQLIEDLKECL